MDNKETLELAAQAADIEILESRLDDPYHGNLLIVHRCIPLGHGWNPIHDDADALALAVKLNIPLQFPENGTVARTQLPMDPTQTFDEPAANFYKEDLLAACRRAIVRAAAEMGRRRRAA